MFQLDGFLTTGVREEADGIVTPAGSVQMLFSEAERDTAFHVARRWYAKGWKPVLQTKETLEGGTVLFNYKNNDRVAAANKARRRKAA